jgi:hypothetical protein
MTTRGGLSPPTLAAASGPGWADEVPASTPYKLIFLSLRSCGLESVFSVDAG